MEDAFLIEACSPEDRAQIIRIGLEKAFLNEIKAVFPAMLAQGIGLVLGKCLGRSVLTQPRAIFMGLNRPLSCPTPRAWHTSEGEAKEWYSADRMHIYVACPAQDCALTPDGLAGALPPIHSVFVTYVRMWEREAVRPLFRDPTTGRSYTPNGLVASWEWIACDPDDESLPNDYNRKRFGTEVLR